MVEKKVVAVSKKKMARRSEEVDLGTLMKLMLERDER